MHNSLDYAWIGKTLIYTMHDATHYSLSMKHLSNWMNSPKFKTKIGKIV